MIIDKSQLIPLKRILMPGDHACKFPIAETYLKDVVQINGVRNMLGYTGTYKGKEQLWVLEWVCQVLDTHS